MLLGDAHADQRASNGTQARADGRAAQGRSEGTRRDEWPDTRDGEGADTDQPAAEATQHATCRRAPVAAPLPAWVPVSSARSRVSSLSGDRMLMASARKAIVLEGLDRAARVSAIVEDAPTTVEPRVVGIAMVCSSFDKAITAGNA